MARPRREAGQPVIIETSTNSNIVMEWEEHLCLHRQPNGKWQIDVRTWMMAADAAAYWDDDAGRYVLPEQIDGVDVVGVEGDYVVVATLWPAGDERVYRFVKFDARKFNRCFGGDWSDEVTRRKIAAALSIYPKVG